MDNNNGGYANIVKLGKLDAYQGDCVEGNLSVNAQDQLVAATGSVAAGTCYSFKDKSVFEEGTYYYLLEDVSTDGSITFHCNDIDAVVIAQGPTIDLESAKKYCKKVTNSED